MSQCPLGIWGEERPRQKKYVGGLYPTGKLTMAMEYDTFREEIHLQMVVCLCLFFPLSC